MGEKIGEKNTHLEDPVDNPVIFLIESIDQHNEFLTEQVKQVRLQINILQIIVHKYDLGEQLGSVFPQNQLITVHVQTNFRAGKEMVQDLDQNMLVELEVDLYVLEQGVNDHDVKVFLEGPVEDDLVVVFVDVVDNEWDKDLHLWVFLDDVDN